MEKPGRLSSLLREAVGAGDVATVKQILHADPKTKR